MCQNKINKPHIHKILVAHSAAQWLAGENFLHEMKFPEVSK
jgi:hypothetical protein